MKHLLFLSLTTLTLLTGCHSKKEENFPKGSFSYFDVRDLKISWSEVLNQKEEMYMTYFYSESCGYCNQIKHEVIGHVLGSTQKIYFVEFSDEIPLINDRNKVIGLAEISEAGIVGTPSMFVISSHVITDYIVGANNIIETLTN